MKVSVYKDLGSGMSILVQASIGKGLAPVMIPGITRGNLAAKLLPVLDGMRRGKRVDPAQPPQE